MPFLRVLLRQSTDCGIARHPGLANQDYQLDLDASMDQPPFAIRIPGPKPGPEVIEILDDSDGESESKEPDHEYVEISD
jgi:hypothetical protein